MNTKERMEGELAKFMDSKRLLTMMDYPDKFYTEKVGLPVEMHGIVTEMGFTAGDEFYVYGSGNWIYLEQHVDHVPFRYWLIDGTAKLVCRSLSVLEFELFTGYFASDEWDYADFVTFIDRVERSNA